MRKSRPITSPKPLSRKEFIHLVLASTWAAILSACVKVINLKKQALPTQTATATPSETPKPSDTPTPTPTETVTPSPTPTSTQTPTTTELPCFHLISPEDGAVLSTIGRVKFYWEEQTGAASYRLEINLPNGSTETYEAETNSFELYLASLSLGGEYAWQVTALDMNQKIICISAKSNFSKPATPPTDVENKKERPDGSGNEGGNEPPGPPPPGTEGP